MNRDVARLISYNLIFKEGEEGGGCGITFYCREMVGGK